MAEKVSGEGFYERFWSDARYQFEYACDSAVRDRFPAIQQVYGTLRKPATVLDFGCGNGVLTHWMHANGFSESVTGVDVSRTAIENARKQFAAPGLSFETYDPEQSLEGLGRFDVIVASHVLEHITDARRVVRELSRMARWLVLEVPLEDCLVQTALWKLRGRPRTDNPLGHVQFWTRKSFHHFLESEDLSVVRSYHYASAPFSPFSSPWKRILERGLLTAAGVALYGRLMATHYAVLACRNPWAAGAGPSGPES